VIDVLDNRSRRLVRRGSASRRLAIDEVPTPDQVEQRVAEILARFPPGS